MAIADRLRDVRAAIEAACSGCGRDPAAIGLLAVSKRHPPESVLEAIACGLTEFGENRVQELVEKSEQLADAIPGPEWHAIGSLQTNKVPSLLRVPNLTLLHTLDRGKLADVLQSALDEVDRELPVLLQINATGEEAKHGAHPSEVRELLRRVQSDCPNLQVLGLMAMGPRSGDPEPVFAQVANLHDELRDSSGLELPIRSMGMTGDMEAAIAAGATLIRVGTGIFGPRST